MGTDQAGSGDSQTHPRPNSTSAGDEMSQLRDLLLRPELDQLENIRRRLDDPLLHAEDLSRSLPRAITLSAGHGDQLGRALQPTVEQAVRVSVKKDSRVLVDALFPVMGPAIRKAIASALRGMVESLDKVLRQSLSIQGLRWRLEALRTGKSFAEVALAHSLLYRVEQVFLIHKQTGLLLQHVVADHVSAQDGDMVSGMLTAIQDFVRDSFKVQDGSGLETLQVGPLTVIVEQGPQAVLAAVVRGQAPLEYKQILEETQEQIHEQESPALEAYDGDSSRFEPLRDLLESCLQVRYQAETRKSSPALWVAAGFIALAVGVWGFFALRENIRWNGYLDELRAQEGLIITASGRMGGKLYVAGLRDPLAADPAAILGRTRLDPAGIIGRWEPYQSLQPAFTLARANRLMQPPETVSLRIADGVLAALGVAPSLWISEAGLLARGLPGISRFDISGLSVMETKLAEGIKAVEGQPILFLHKTTELTRGGQQTMTGVKGTIGTLDRYARILRGRLIIQVTGHTDTTGLFHSNRLLSRERAEKVRGLLQPSGLTASQIETMGVASLDLARAERTEEDRSLNRRATIRIVFRSGSQ